MANFEVSVGEEVMVSLAGNDYLASVQGKVMEVHARSLHISLSEPAPFLQSAVMVMIKPIRAPQFVGWSVLEKMVQSSDGTALKVSYPHWEFLGRARATRFPEQLPVVVRWAPPNNQDTELTGGKTVNISLSGARIRVRKPLPLGSLVHIQLYLRPERVASVIGQVVRAVDSDSAGEEGYEVGVHFVRFLSGYADFVREVSEEPESLDERYLLTHGHSPFRSSQGEEQEMNQGEAA